MDKDTRQINEAYGNLGPSGAGFAQSEPYGIVNVYHGYAENDPQSFKTYTGMKSTPRQTLEREREKVRKEFIEDQQEGEDDLIDVDTYLDEFFSINENPDGSLSMQLGEENALHVVMKSDPIYAWLRRVNWHGEQRYASITAEEWNAWIKWVEDKW